MATTEPLRRFTEDDFDIMLETCLEQIALFAYTHFKEAGVWLATELRTLCDDCAAWIAHAVYPSDEIAVRFHHRLTAIRPFANGNGRHARLMPDILLARLLKQPRFTWEAATWSMPEITGNSILIRRVPLTSTILDCR